MVSRALVIGESLVDVIVNEAGKVLSVNPGGSAVNVAVGLARLGVTTQFHTRIGAGRHGDLVCNHLELAGATLTAGSRHDGITSTAIAEMDESGAATYDFDIAWEPRDLDAAGFDIVHTGSLATALAPGAAVVERILERTDARISFDPNIRPSALGDRDVVRNRVERIVARSHVAKASDEDLDWLYPGVPAIEAIEHWADLGADLAVVTRGADGAEALHGGVRTHVPAPRTTVVDTIGAGDSFMAGLIVGLVRDGLGDVRSLLEFAARCAAITVSRRGANPPGLEELRDHPGKAHHAP